jgi:hypothetical protein
MCLMLSSKDLFVSWGFSSAAPSAMVSCSFIQSNVVAAVSQILLGSGEAYRVTQSYLSPHLTLNVKPKQSTELTKHDCSAAQATVGAGLPVIATLRHLVETGDKILRVEGIFSGTLSYIFNSLAPGLPFSDVVAQAKALGFTEPDPRDDLAGMDVARKVTILARCACLECSALRPAWIHCLPA